MEERPNEVSEAERQFVALLFLVCLALSPLGAWKAIELVVWLVTHVKVSVE